MCRNVLMAINGEQGVVISNKKHNYLRISFFCATFACNLIDMENNSPSNQSSSLIPLTGSGSNRRYFRQILADGTSLICVEGTSREENHAFISMARHFCSLGLPVPTVLSVSDDEMTYTQNDLGNTLLFDYIRSGRQSGHFSEAETNLLTKTLRALVHIQVEGAENFDWSVCYPVAEFNRRSIYWDLNYWKYCFLKITGVEFAENPLEDDFDRLADTLLGEQILGFMYRDCQSRNVMVVSQNGTDTPYFIDFQGGRKGPIQYDVASFLWQAKANFPDALREQLIDAYLDEWQTLCLNRGQNADTQLFRRSLPHFVLFRTLQVLGAYGYRGCFERKQHFLESIPFALRNLQRLFEQHPVLQSEYPAIYALSRQLAAPPLAAMPSPAATAPDTQKSNTAHDTPDMQNPDAAPDTHNLLVTIYSFSYKRGIPADVSGNGGGYVFDCRSTHNPGKYDQYKSLTGRDKPVIDFLEQDGEILTFLHSVYALLDHHVERFIARGFTHLQVCFGCTGGQHRSVYSAQAAARHLHDKYGVRIHLIHREQQIEEYL